MIKNDAEERRAQLEHAVVDALRACLGRYEWTVREEPIVGMVRPDLLVADQTGRVVAVVEVKLGAGSSHFGWLAQLASFRHLVETAEGATRVRGVLLTDRDVSDNLLRAADELGLEIVSQHTDDPTALAVAFADRVTSAPGVA